MKKMTGLLAVLCMLPTLTGCSGTDGAVSQTDTQVIQTTVSTAAETTVSTAAQTTAAVTTAETTGESTDTQTTSGTTGKASAGKTTTVTTGTTAPEEEQFSATLTGHIAVYIDDIVTEYGETTCTEGYVVCRRFEAEPQVLTLPLDTCSKLKIGMTYALDFQNLQVTDAKAKFFFYKDGGKVYADYTDLLEKYAKEASVRDVKDGEYGLDCDATECVGLAADKMPENPMGSPAKSKAAFKATVIKGYSAEAFKINTYDYLLLLRDNEPVILKAKEKLSEKVTAGKEYQFSFGKDGALVR